MTVPFLQSRSIKLKVAARFPAMAVGRNGITVNKVNGTYYLDLDYSRYVPISIIPPGDVPNLYSLLWNAATGVYELAPISVIGQVYTFGATQVVSGSYIVQQNDGVIICQFTAPGTITLPLASLHNGPVHISDGALNAGTNNILINPSGSETIVGLPSWTLAANGAGITLYPVSGVGWFQ